MPMTEGCWASALGGCEGPISREHQLSVSIWLPERPTASRKERERHMIVKRVGGVERHLPVKQAVESILCIGHNGGSRSLDAEAGRFAQALEALAQTYVERQHNRVEWVRRRHVLEGTLLQRWFMKTLVNCSQHLELPIGAVDAGMNRPTERVVEMIYGRHSVASPFGVWFAAFRGPLIPDDEVSFYPWIHRTGYVGGALIWFRGWRFLVNLAPELPDDDYLRSIDTKFADAEWRYPFRGGGLKGMGFELQVRWPLDTWPPELVRFLQGR